MEDLERHISIIIFADIVGYSSMMQTNESEALSKLKHFEDVLEAQTKKHDGEIIKAYGDGCLMLFSSAINAIKCARAIQKKLQKAPRVPLRIGIHVGEIVRKGHDIFGDGVNIASRIESMGVPNSILISEDIYYQIKNRPEFKTLKLGDFAFKNIDRDISLYALSNKGLAVPETDEMQGKGSLSNNSKGTSKKKMKALWTVALILVVAMSYMAFQGQFFVTDNETEPPKGLVFASKIEANGKAINPGTNFSADITDLYAVFRSDLAPPGFTINADSIIPGEYYAYLKRNDDATLNEFGWRWYRDSEVVNDFEMEISNKKNIWLQRYNYSGDGVFGEFGPGTYNIVILLDGNPALSTELIIAPISEDALNK
ncbi:MAG: adenylate/guanylate cyclase domain-containing protein [Flavobacteriaceae bacterium]|nr:adenylate/guanylate cyclase domain-containing protein [Flavobacteriaceae bacterium]NNK26781.1 adenylate/guanylate cyclase domain-containing protein [Flavobacteriaceae bacterium]RZV66351.1 MAG: adenylate/guanylate cyclase domain-containing protein [Flavobacteriaceae bacterium]